MLCSISCSPQQCARLLLCWRCWPRRPPLWSARAPTHSPTRGTASPAGSAARWRRLPAPASATTTLPIRTSGAPGAHRATPTRRRNQRPSQRPGQRPSRHRPHQHQRRPRQRQSQHPSRSSAYGPPPMPMLTSPGARTSARRARPSRRWRERKSRASTSRTAVASLRAAGAFRSSCELATHR